MKNVFCLIIVLLTARVMANAGPSSDDPDRPTNRVRNERSVDGRRTKPGLKVGTKAFFERLQGKLGMSDDCEVYNDLGVARCATHRKQPSRRCTILEEGAFDANGQWYWHNDVQYTDRPKTAPPAPRKVSSTYEPATPKTSVPKARPPKATPAPDRPPQKTSKSDEVYTRYTDRTSQNH